MLDFESNSIWLNLLLFSGAAGVVWYAGTKLERQADAIAWRTGLGHAFIGMLLLAGATSLPEVATTVTAVWIGNLSMAVHNLLGSVVFNTAALAIADAVSGRSALTHRSPRYVLFMTGGGVVLLLSILLMAGSMAKGIAETGSAADWLFHARFWEVLVILAYLGMVYMTHRGQSHPRWKPISAPADSGKEEERQFEQALAYRDWSSAKLYSAFGAASLAVVAAAWLLTQSGDALARQTGLGEGFVGFALIALATTLPEISTTVAAARAGNDNMAVSNIFGSSAFVLLLLGLIALFIGSEVWVLVASPSGSFAIGLGIIVTLTYLWGLLEREDRTFLRMGWDSVAVVGLVLGGSWVIYLLE